MEMSGGKLTKISEFIHGRLAQSFRRIKPRPKHEGFVDERSTQHVAGWLYNRLDPNERVAFEVVQKLPRGERSLGRGRADTFYKALVTHSFGDACYGFQFLFPEPLTEAERDTIVVRTVATAQPLQLSPHFTTAFELISYIAMDIVNNCNLRCPFCLFDYSGTKTTRFMTDETFDRVLKLLPSVRDAGFWLSCLHEPSLHPNFLNMIDRIPRQWRQKVMFTTNLAKRMPDSYFETLAESGVYHINISLESLTPEIFEKLRKGARWPIFKENWDRLMAAWITSPAPPRLRYIAMAYKSNFTDIPNLVKYLRAERAAWQVEVRHTYDMEHISADFRETEYLVDADWDWLAAQLAEYPEDEVLLIPPLKPLEAAAQPAPSFIENLEISEILAPERAQKFNPQTSIKKQVPLPLNMQVEWNGDMIICGRWSHPSERKLIEIANINGLDNPYRYLAELAEMPLQMIQGYVDEISDTMVTGWIRDAYDPAVRVPFDVALVFPEETRVLAHSQADQLHPTLAGSEFGDGHYGFRIEFAAPLTAYQRDRLVVRPANTKIPLERAPKYQGFIDERSIHHVAGWVLNRFDPEERVSFDVVIVSANSEHFIAQGRAEQFYPPLAAQMGKNVLCGFKLLFERPLTEADRDCLAIRVSGHDAMLDLSPWLSSAFGPSEIAFADPVT